MPIAALGDTLPTDGEAIQAMILAERSALAAEAEGLRQIIKEMQNRRFGRRADRLDIVPAQCRVLVVRRPAYDCRASEDAIVQAPGRPPG